MTEQPTADLTDDERTPPTAGVLMPVDVTYVEIDQPTDEDADNEAASDVPAEDES